MSLAAKLKMFAVFVTQKFFGPFKMWTKVNFKPGEPVVVHSTRIKKWGITFLRSEKNIHLDPNGLGLKLEGVEYYWPLFWMARPFSAVSGVVHDSTTSASYEMPLMGSVCQCETLLGPREGEIKIATQWMKGRYVLKDESMQELRRRF